MCFCAQAQQCRSNTCCSEKLIPPHSTPWEEPKVLCKGNTRVRGPSKLSLPPKTTTMLG